MKIDRKLNQKMVYWPDPTPDGRGGHTFATAVERDCRYEMKQELFIDIEGNEVLSSAVTYCNFDLTRGVDGWGWIYFGEESDLSSDHSNPNQLDSGRIAFKVRQFQKMPNVRGTQFLRKAWLTISFR